MANKWITWFEECGKEDTPLVGSKNANLGEMLRKGMPVPPGFAVTIESYNEFMHQTGIVPKIVQCLAKLPQESQTPRELKETSEYIQSIMVQNEISQDIQEVILSAYEELGRRCERTDVPVAVRSSGVAEDLPTASFAGQYDSYLNVRGKDDLLDKIKRCWASLFTARSILYRIKNNLPILETSISVGVQKLVDARSAGVVFTVHPGTGDDAKILLEGNWGTGESVVQGMVIPDIFVINKETLTVEEKKINPKLKQIVIGQMGTEEHEVAEDKQSLPCLSDEEVLKIAELAKATEKSYGMPLDLEWVVDQALPFPKNIFLVQARPVTTVVERKDAIDRILDMIMGR